VAQISKDAELFQKFLPGRKILIADSNAGSRSSLFNVLKEMGAKSNQLFLANTYKAAEEQIAELKPHVVIAEYEFGPRCGLELLQSQREQRPKETKDCIFIIVTGNTSQTAAARALEEDIDAYIIKPYTLEFVRKTILNAAIQKIRPPEYLKTIEQGKARMEEAKLDEAEELFNKATKLDPAPSLAYYYLGQVKFLREIVAQAQSNYMKGLKFNGIHYKCLVGMYELLMKERRHKDAYDVVKKIAKYFPANPKRLGEVLRLAIMTGEYEDIERYYLMFMTLDQRNETLIRYTTAALVVCGKYYLDSNQGAGKALDIFNKAAVTSMGSPRVLSEIIPVLIENNLPEEAEKFLKRFPPETHKGKEFQVMNFLILNGKSAPSLVVEQGRRLLAQGIEDPRLYEVMIKRSVEANLGAAAEDLVRSAVAKYPAKKELFESLLKRSSP